MYVCMYVCMHACMHACMYVCMHVCMYVCMYVCTYVYIVPLSFQTHGSRESQAHCNHLHISATRREKSTHWKVATSTHKTMLHLICSQLEVSVCQTVVLLDLFASFSIDLHTVRTHMYVHTYVRTYICKSGLDGACLSPLDGPPPPSLSHTFPINT